jgi:hypothetical protein
MGLFYVAFFPSVESGAGQPEISSGIGAVAKFVHEEFDDQLDPQAVDDCLDLVVARFEGATVRTFVPLLVRRYAREELQTRLEQPR